MLKTRLDGRTSDNNSFSIKDVNGETVATVACISNTCELDITTSDGLHIEKPNGFSSKTKEKE